MRGTFGMSGYRDDTGINLSGGQSAARAESVARSAEKRVRVIEANLAKTLMICESLWELLRDKHGWTDQALYKKLHEVDMRDGVLDGKNQRKAVDCPDCGHKVSPRHQACIYCGRVIDTSVFSIE